MLGQWQNPVYQRISGPIVLLTWTIVHFSHEEASRQSATATLDASSSGIGNIPSEFVNHGLLLWNQTRQQWVGNKKSENQAQRLCEPRLSWNAAYESLLASNKRFTKPIPLTKQNIKRQRSKSAHRRNSM